MAANSSIHGSRHDDASPSWPDQRVGAFTSVPGLLSSMGADPGRILAMAGLSPDALDRADQRVPYASLGHLLCVAAEQTKCPHFGLLCGEAWQLRDYGFAGEIARNCETVGAALRMFVLYQRLNSGGAMTFLVDHGASADFGYAIYQPEVAGSEHIYASALAGAVNLLRELCGGAWPIQTVLLPHARPAHIAEYRRVFHGSLRFDSDRAALRFPREWLAHPVPGADAAQRRVLEARAQEFGPGAFVDRVVRALRTLLIVGRHSGDDVAQSLALHRRTLNRRLKAHGTSFQAVLDGVRYDFARQLLADGEIPMDEIAMTLGYSGLSSFQRTFRRWSGNTPGRWRNEARAAHLTSSVEVRA